MKTAEEKARELYPDGGDPNELRYVIAKKKQQAFLEGYEYANQQPKGELHDGTLLWRELLNQMQTYSDEVEKGHLDGKVFAKFVRESVERIFSNYNAK